MNTYPIYFTGLEFAYSQAPPFMQGLVMGLFLMTSGIGNYVSQLILTIVQESTKGGKYMFRAFMFTLNGIFSAELLAIKGHDIYISNVLFSLWSLNKINQSR